MERYTGSLEDETLRNSINASWYALEYTAKYSRNQAFLQDMRNQVIEIIQKVLSIKTSDVDLNKKVLQVFDSEIEQLHALHNVHQSQLNMLIKPLL